MAFVKSVPQAEESVATVMRRYPAQAIALTELTNIIMRSGDCAFTSEQRELIAAYSSGLNDCTYCYNTHKATAEAFGVDENLLESMLGDLDASAVDDKLKPVLRFVKNSHSHRHGWCRLTRTRFSMPAGTKTVFTIR